MNPNTTLLQAKNSSTPDLTPAPLAGSSSGVSFAFQNLLPPSELYVNVDDQLIISAATGQSNEIVTVNVRLMLPTGRIEDMQFLIRPANTRTVLKQAFGLAEGYLLSVSANAAVAVTRGQTFVRVALQRSASGAGNPAYCLMADYVTTQSAPGYPNGRILSPVEGPGFVYVLNPSNPGAGADWTVTVPANTRWRVRGWQGLFTTSAAVANRQIYATARGGVGAFWNGPPSINAVASTAYTVAAGGVSPYTTTAPQYVGLALPPDLVMSGTTGFAQTIQSTTANIQAADQWSNINILLEEWLDNV